MATDTRNSPAEDFVDRRVRYKIDLGDRIVVVENVPARICVQTGEELFAPETAEQIWKIVRSGQPPARVMQADVYDYE